MRAFIAVTAILIATAAAAQETASHDCPELPRTVLPLPSQRSSSACANGDFETGVDAKEWFGQHGSLTWTGDPIFHVEGLQPGALGSCDAVSCAAAAVAMRMVAKAMNARMGASQFRPRRASTSSARSA